MMPVRLSSIPAAAAGEVSWAELEVLGEAVRQLAAGTLAVCPRCCDGLFTRGGYPAHQPPRHWPPPAALSRTDNRTLICAACGTDEALAAARGERVTKDRWGDRPAGLDQRSNDE
jgi:hypothetical protein